MMILEGVIRNVVYQPMFKRSVEWAEYDFASFDVNSAKSFGRVVLDEQGDSISYAKWVSPKRTRSYPLARLYNIYHTQSKRIAIIPIMKDEGIGGDNDRINFMTLSWMNLANIYIILAYYETAQKHPTRPDKITKQKLNASHVQALLEEIAYYQPTALHWNVMHFERDFESIYVKAVDAYQAISRKTQTPLHASSDHLKVLHSYQYSGQFTLDAFRKSLENSLHAAIRETETVHTHEYVTTGSKGYFFIQNNLGGVYHLTVDSVSLLPDGSFLIQESKNATNDVLPKESDIADGLFKLILFTNLDELWWNNQQVPYQVRLELTGNLIGELHFPTEANRLDTFSHQNKLSKSKQNILRRLNEESLANPKLSIQVRGNHA